MHFVYVYIGKTCIPLSDFEIVLPCSIDLLPLLPPPPPPLPKKRREEDKRENKIGLEGVNLCKSVRLFER